MKPIPVTYLTRKHTRAAAVCTNITGQCAELVTKDGNVMLADVNTLTPDPRQVLLTFAANKKQETR